MFISKKAPSFWYPSRNQKIPAWTKFLIPLAYLYGKVIAKKSKRNSGYTSSLPVVCLGNVVAGGTGKTPCAITIFKMVKKMKLADNPCFLIRGYGGTEKGPLLVDRERHDSKRIGDEARILSKIGPVIVSANRELGAKLAEKQGFDAIIMDDGYQNFGLNKDIHILVVDARGFGNRNLIPAGPLREPLESAIMRADAVLFTGDPTPEDMDTIYEFQKPCFTTYHKAYSLSKYNLEMPFIGFAGIGNPDKFKLTLQMNGFTVSDFHPFPDHHPYTESDLKKLLKNAHKNEAQLITTSKDYVRIPKKYRHGILKLETKLKIVEKADFKKFLRDKWHVQKS